MKILLDESVPQKLRLIIEGGHTGHCLVSSLVWFEERSFAECSGRSGFRFVHHGGSGIELPAKSNRAKDELWGILERRRQSLCLFADAFGVIGDQTFRVVGNDSVLY